MKVLRLRKKPWADDFIKNHSEYIIKNPEDLKGQWHHEFKNKGNDIEIEIGCGKGDFILEMAKQNPQINYLGIEIQRSVLAIAVKKVVNENLTNVKFINGDGKMIRDFFDDLEISKIYLNFSDPWPKKRHIKRRLTSPDFLKIYQLILPKKSKIEFKTDNKGLFEYSLTSFNNFGFVFDKVNLDLHNSIEAKDNVETEYEKKFSKKGPIYKVIVHAI